MNSNPKFRLWQSPRLKGLGLIIVGIVVFSVSCAPNQPHTVTGSIIGAALATVCVGAGAMMLMGFLGESADVKLARRQAAERVAQGGWTPISVPERSYRYSVSRLRYGFVILMSACFIGAGLFLCWVLEKYATSGSEIGLGVGGFFSIMGLLGLVYVYRQSHIHIDVSSWGLSAQVLTGKIDIPWREITSFKTFDLSNVEYGRVGTIYKVYSLGRTLEFYDSLEGAPHLIATIRYAISNTWPAGQPQLQTHQ